MKKIVILLIGVVMLLSEVAMAQTQDTIRGRSRTYYYDSWFDTNMGYCHDSVWSANFTGGLWCYGGYGMIMAISQYAKRPISVKGVVAFVKEVPPTGSLVYGNERLPEYVSIASYAQYADSMDFLATARWDTLTPKKLELKLACDSSHYMNLTTMIEGDGWIEYCDAYEAYFDSAIIVDSTFWIAGTANNFSGNLNIGSYIGIPFLYWGIDEVYPALRDPSSSMQCWLSQSTHEFWVTTTPGGGWIPYPDFHNGWGFFLPIVDYQYYVEGTISSDGKGGTVEGSDWYISNTPMDLYARPELGYRFVSWNDGDTCKHKQDTVVQDITYVAYFVRDTNYCDVSADSQNPAYGYVEGGGMHLKSTMVELNAIPTPGYKFVDWSDGDRTRLEVLASDNNIGRVAGSGLYTQHTQVEISASTVSPRFAFLKWSDGNVDNPRYVWVDSDTSFTAMFGKAPATGIENVEMGKVVIMPNPANAMVDITSEYMIKELVCYDVKGRMVAEYLPNDIVVKMDVNDWSAGIYVVRITTERGTIIRKLIVE